MRIPSHQLAKALKQPLPLYIISGDEPLLMQEAADQFRETVRQQGFAEREIFNLESGFDWQQLLQSANNLSLFGERKLIELRTSKNKLDDKARKALSEYLTQANPDTLLLISMPKLERSTLNSAWFKKQEPQIGLCQIWPLDDSKLPGWIRQRMQRAGFQPDQQAVETMAHQVQGNLLAAAQEIDKLRLLLPNGPINDAMIKQAVADQARFSLFDLIDEALRGNLTQSLRILEFLQQTDQEATLVLWALSKEVRTLASIAFQVAQGATPAAAFKQQKVWENRKGLLQNSLKRLRYQDYQRALALAATADLCIKGMASGDPWQLFREILLILANTPVMEQPAAALTQPETRLAL